MPIKNSTKRVLVIDDEKPLANALVAKLKAVGFEALALYSGEGVTEELDQHQYDVVLLDLLMPVVDGWAVLEKLKNKGPKVIITSNLSQEEDIKRARSLGASDFMVKSEVSLTEIVDNVTQLAGLTSASTKVVA